MNTLADEATVSTETAVPACAAGGCALAWRREAEGTAAGWPAVSVGARLQVLRRARHLMAEQAEALADAISPTLARNRADSLVSEVLPLLDACKFLEREAKDLLRPRKLGRRGRPFWLRGVGAEVHREPLGKVLVIGPANFPLFLPGVQTLQALAAGNTVAWKPGAGGAAVAQLVAECLRKAGLPRGALQVTEDSVAAAQSALESGADKVVFTGSSQTGRAVLRMLAETATPAVVELSGADAIVVMPDADLQQVAKAVAFGLRLNGGAVCMSPRRLFATAATMQALRPLLVGTLAEVRGVRLDAATSTKLRAMLEEATLAGARLLGELRPEEQRPLVVDHAVPAMAVAREDIFAPVISLLEAETLLHVPEMMARCAYGLTAAVFCARRSEGKARRLAAMLKAGTVLINDVIAPTADPRTPFGGRGASGYGVTRGAEGLLAMTAVKTVIVRRGGGTRHLEATQESDAALFAALIATVHGSGGSQRWAAVRRLMGAVRARG